jgi:hypothetical protein
MLSIKMSLFILFVVTPSLFSKSGAEDSTFLRLFNWQMKMTYMEGTQTDILINNYSVWWPPQSH